jgi:hypothetical protein
MSDTIKFSKALAKRMQTRSPNKGFGFRGKWPMEPLPFETCAHVITCQLLGVTVKDDAKFRYSQGKGATRAMIEADAISFRAHYRWEDEDGETLKFDGETIIVPKDVDKLPEEEGCKQQTRADIQIDRLLGQIEGVVGEVPTDPNEGIRRIDAMFREADKNESPVEVEVKLNFELNEYTNRAGKDVRREEACDFIQSIVSGPGYGEEEEEETEDTKGAEEEEGEETVEEE